MVTHYEPYIDEEDGPHPFCGVNCAETSTTDNNWEWVSCKKCLKLRDKAQGYINQVEGHILQDMENFNEFMRDGE